MRKLLLIIIILLAFRYVHSQDTISLPEMINMALEKNYQIQISKRAQSIAQNNNTLGNAGFLPQADVSAERSYSIENSESQFFTGDSRVGENAKNSALNAFVEVSWTVFDGLKMFAQKDRLEQLYALSHLETRYFIEQTVSGLAKLYYQLKLENELLKNYKESMAISSFRLQLEEKKLAVGSGTTFLLNQALIDFNEDSIRLMEQATEVENLKLEINNILNRDLNALFYVSKAAWPDFSIPNKDSLLVLAVENNINLKQERIEELLAETDVHIAKADRYPQISLFGNYGYNQQTSEVGFVESRQSYGPQYGVRLQFNLYNGGETHRQVKNTRIEQDMAVLDKERVKDNIQSALLQNINTHQNYLNGLAISQKSLDAAQKNLEIAQKQLELGAINGFDFRETQERLLNVKNSRADLEFQRLSSVIDMMRLSGNLVGFLME